MWKRVAVATIVIGLGACAPRNLFVREGSAERGARLFTERGCHGCHTVGVLGTPIGPDLRYVGRRHDRSFFVEWLRDPAAQAPNAHMARFELTEREREDLAAYLATLR